MQDVQNSPEFSYFAFCNECKSVVELNPKVFNMVTITYAFGYLDMIRETGRVNMMAAPTLLTDNFYNDYNIKLSKHEARDLAKLWMTTFKYRHPAVSG